MKRVIILCLCMALLICTGCSKRWSGEKGHIYRHDVEPSDFAFLYDEWKYEPGMSRREVGEGFLNALKGERISPDDIFDELGLPFSIDNTHGYVNYTYLIGNEFDGITILYLPDKGVVDVDSKLYYIEDEEDAESLLLQWAAGDQSDNPDRYKMYKRYNIDEKNLTFINEKTTSEHVQQKLGAPHYFIESRETGIDNTSGNVIVYELKNEMMFKIIYFREGYILRAWVEDSDGNEIEVLINRESLDYYDEVGHT